MCYWKISKNLSAPHVEMISSYLEKKVPHVLSRLFNLLMRFNFSALLPLLLLLAHAEKYVEHEFSLFHILYTFVHTSNTLWRLQMCKHALKTRKKLFLMYIYVCATEDF